MSYRTSMALLILSSFLSQGLALNPNPSATQEADLTSALVADDECIGGSTSPNCALNALQLGAAEHRPEEKLPHVLRSSAVAGISVVLEAVHADAWTLSAEAACFLASLWVVGQCSTRQSSRRGGKKNAPKRQELASSPSNTKEKPAAANALEELRLAKVKGCPLSANALRAVAQALAASSPDIVVAELNEHITTHAPTLAKTQTVHSLIEVLVRQAGRPDLAEAFCLAVARQALVAELAQQPDSRSRELLIEGYSTLGQEEKVKLFLTSEEGNSLQGKVPGRTYSVAIKGLLKCGKVVAARNHLLDMHKQGLELPPRAVAELLKVAAVQGTEALQETLRGIEGSAVASAVAPEGVAQILTDCAQRDDVVSALAMEEWARVHNVELNFQAFESLLKLQSRGENSAHANQLWKEMQQAGGEPSEGLCGCLLAGCSESQNMELADSITTYLRSRSMMTLAAYKTLMKVYASGGHYDRACGLYDDVVRDGIEPDNVMYGCLVKFAVKCGRTDLSQQLFEKVGGGCVQNYMWLIRSAGRDGDSTKAIQLLRQMEARQPEMVDIMVYNCVLDACVLNNEMGRAESILEEMRARGLTPNLVTHNTLMKGHCARGDFVQANGVMRQMEEQGLTPDTASYNSLISTAVTAGNMQDAWDILSTMEAKGVAFDQYTTSIVMKAARRAQTPQEAERALKFLDRAGLNVCEDEVLFNTVLDACIHRKDKAHLRKALDTYATSKMRPSVRTYGLLIKASSLLKDTARCWAFWEELTKQRRMEPNDITLSCMMDALIEGNRIEAAVSIFQQWKGKVPTNTIIYSTLIKGFASTGDADRAMAAYHDMQAAGYKMNMVAYTALIDAHARNGNMEQAKALFQRMEEDGCQPNTITFSNLVKCYCKCGELAEALRTFHKMLERGISADSVIFNTLLDGCVRATNWELADRLLEDMTSYGVEPSNFTLSIIVKMWGKRRQLDKAFQAIHDAIQKPRGRNVDSLVGACLVGACLHNGAMDRALEALAEIKASHRLEGPCANTYGALVCGFARNGLYQKAVELAEEACGIRAGAGVTPAPMLKADHLKQLFKMLHQNSKAKPLAEALSNNLRAVGAPSFS